MPGLAPREGGDRPPFTGPVDNGAPVGPVNASGTDPPGSPPKDRRPWEGYGVYSSMAGPSQKTVILYGLGLPGGQSSLKETMAATRYTP
jgi:hypothetical protein